MKITVAISMYPLDADYKPAIKKFIRRLRDYPGMTIITNQMSTHVNGEFGAVSKAINECMQHRMEQEAKVVFVMRYLNADLDIEHLPDID